MTVKEPSSNSGSMNAKRAVGLISWGSGTVSNAVRGVPRSPAPTPAATPSAVQRNSQAFVGEAGVTRSVFVLPPVESEEALSRLKRYAEVASGYGK